ncbi:MAG TPA: hypothetical protein VFV99_04920 [Kofleriaceae bacterium]|nr:hypothetical protein [Kofleriaceae bacterium]
MRRLRSADWPHAMVVASATASSIACGRFGFVDAPDGAIDVPNVIDASTCFGKPFGAAQPVAMIHQAGYDDWGGSPTANGSELYFHSFRPAALAGANIFVAKGTAPNSYGIPELVMELSTGGAEFQPTVTADGLDVIFAADMGLPYLLELYESQRASTTTAWSPPARIAELGTDAQHQLDPWLTADGLALYYGIGPDLNNAKLYRATRASRQSMWNGPVLVPGIQGAGPFAVSPTLSPDEREIWFATDLDSPGNLDIVTARRPDRDSPFGALERVMPLNTPADDAALHLSVDGRYLYLVENTDYVVGGNATISVATRICE